MKVDSAELQSQLGKLVFSTGAFLVAWSWVLVYYSLSHAVDGDSPLNNQTGLSKEAERSSLVLLILPYLVVCTCSAAICASLKGSSWSCAAAVTLSAEFFPSPVFNGTLLAFLGRFSGGFKLTLYNLVISWIVAAVVHFLPTTGKLGAVSDVMRKTVSFGFGLASYIFTGGFPASPGLLRTSLVLVLLLVLSARLATQEPSDSSLRARHDSLLCFASRVACAFTLVDWFTAMLGRGWLQNLCSLALLLVLASLVAAVVARADLETFQQQVGSHRQSGSWLEKCLYLLVMVPCVWCCCPWIPILWLVGSGSARGIKNRWMALAVDVCALAASVVGTNLITDLVDCAASLLDVCHGTECNVFVFVFLEISIALLVSVITLPVISCVPSARQEGSPEECLDEALILDRSEAQAA